MNENMNAVAAEVATRLLNEISHRSDVYSLRYSNYVYYTRPGYQPLQIVLEHIGSSMDDTPYFALHINDGVKECFLDEAEARIQIKVHTYLESVLENPIVADEWVEFKNADELFAYAAAMPNDDDTDSHT